MVLREASGIPELHSTFAGGPRRQSRLRHAPGDGRMYGGETFLFSPSARVPAFGSPAQQPEHQLQSLLPRVGGPPSGSFPGIRRQTAAD